MRVERFASGPLGTNAYLVICDQTHEGAIIDPAPESASALIRAAEGVKITMILITHSHWDHIADCKELVDHFGAPVFVHQEDGENLRRPGSDQIPYHLGKPIEGVEPTDFLEDGDRVELGAITLEVIHVPGHAPGQIAFYSKKGKVLFCGDLFFRGAMGSLALPTSEAERMWPSLARIARLPADTRVYSGHGGETTIGEESWLARAHEMYGENQ